jgi:transposase
VRLCPLQRFSPRLTRTGYHRGHACVFNRLARADRPSGHERPIQGRRGPDLPRESDTVKRYTAHHRTTGSLDPKHQARQPPRIAPAQHPALLAQLAVQPDATLEEHCATWAQTQGVQVSVPTMWRAIARVGWTPKKTMAANLPGRGVG